ncbi:MAG: SCP2 sterol-binding domain-containing protein [Smithellaceae bacterium]
MDKPTTIQELMQWMPASFQASKAGNVNASVQFNLTGEGGATWTLKIAEGKCEVKDGAAESPTATVTATTADYLAIVRGDMNAVNAFMSGKIKVTGDLGIMMKFQSWFV